MVQVICVSDLVVKGICIIYGIDCIVSQNLIVSSGVHIKRASTNIV